MASNKLTFIFDADNTKLKKAVEEAKRRLKALENQHRGLEKAHKSGKLSYEEFVRASKKSEKTMRQVEAGLKKEGIAVQGLTQKYERLAKTRAARKTGKGTAGGSSTLALQEFGRGFSDFNVASGGFQDLSRGAIGATNNLERMVEIFRYTVQQSGGLKGAIRALAGSFLGPGGIILGATIFLSFLPQIIKFFEQWSSKSRGAAEAQKEFNKTVEEGNMSLEEFMAGQQQVIREELNSVQARIRKINELEKAGSHFWSKRGKQLSEEREALRKTEEDLMARDNALIDGMQNKSKAALELYEAQMKEKAALEQANEARKAQAEFLKENAELMREVAGLEKEMDIFDEALKDAAGNIGPDNPNEWKVVDADDVQVIEDMTDALADLESALRMTGSAFAGLSEEDATKLMEKMDASKQAFADFSGALIQGFDAAASAGGNFFEALGKGLLQSIGSYLIAEGTAAVASGTVKTYSGWLAGLGVSQISAGYAAIGVGTALKAGGAALGNKGGGGGKGGGKGGAAPSATSAAARGVHSMSDTTNGSLQAVAKVKGQDLILAIERANYSRRGLLPK